MPWKDCRTMDSRLLFIADCLRGLYSMAECCRRHGISRKTGYKWLNRYREERSMDFSDRSRAPKHSPNRVPYAVHQRILELRHYAGLTLGPKKIQALLAQEFRCVPSKTTIYNILRTEGRIERRKPTARVPRYPQPFAPVTAANDVWTVDFKGPFRLGNRRWCYPLTVMDLHSRYLLDCAAQPAIATDAVQTRFERLFTRYGLPARIRSDNGAPFASRAVGGLSALSVWWLKLGILHERITPGRPQQKGAHERMHRTLKQSTTQPPSANITAQQRRFDRFGLAYNTQRPHEALDQQMPTQHYQSSDQVYTPAPPDPQYPEWFIPERVGSNGLIYVDTRQVYLSTTLSQEWVGLEQTAETVYDVYFGPLRLGTFDLKQAKKTKTGPGYLRLKV